VVYLLAQCAVGVLLKNLSGVNVLELSETLVRCTVVLLRDMMFVWEVSSAVVGALLLLQRAGEEFDRLTLLFSNW